MPGLDPAFIKELLATPKRGGGNRSGNARNKAANTLEPRDYATWYNPKLQLQIREEGCSNPNCKDPRPHATDYGTNIVAEFKGEFMCRYCFLDGWLRNKEDADRSV